MLEEVKSYTSPSSNTPQGDDSSDKLLLINGGTVLFKSWASYKLLR